MNCTDCGGPWRALRGERYCQDCTRYEVEELARRADEEARRLPHMEHAGPSDEGPPEDVPLSDLLGKPTARGGTLSPGAFSFTLAVTAARASTLSDRRCPPHRQALFGPHTLEDGEDDRALGRGGELRGPLRRPVLGAKDVADAQRGPSAS
jgi:hypothetical protein